MSVELLNIKLYLKGEEIERILDWFHMWDDADLSNALDIKIANYLELQK